MILDYLWYREIYIRFKLIFKYIKVPLFRDFKIELSLTRMSLLFVS